MSDLKRRIKFIEQQIKPDSGNLQVYTFIIDHDENGWTAWENSKKEGSWTVAHETREELDQAIEERVASDTGDGEKLIIEIVIVDPPWDRLGVKIE